MNENLASQASVLALDPMVNVAQKSGTTARRRQIMAALSAALFGVVLLYGAGFAGADVLHNAAHDGRHSFAFPCH